MTWSEKIIKGIRVILNTLHFILVDFFLFRMMVRVFITMSIFMSLGWIFNAEGLDIPRVLYVFFYAMQVWVVIPMLEYFTYLFDELEEESSLNIKNHEKEK